MEQYPKRFQFVELVPKFRNQVLVGKIVRGLTAFIIVIMIILVLVNGFAVLAKMRLTSKVLLFLLAADFIFGGDRYKPAQCPAEMRFAGQALTIVSQKRFVKGQKYEYVQFAVDYTNLTDCKYEKKNNTLKLAGNISKKSRQINETEVTEQDLAVVPSESISQLTITFSEAPPFDIVKAIEQQR